MPTTHGFKQRKGDENEKNSSVSFEFRIGGLRSAAVGACCPCGDCQNKCLTCHSVAKDKDGPAYKKVAEKYKGKANAEARLIEHITSGEKAKFPDGHEEEHKIVKTSPPKDMEQIKNLVDWILAQ